MLFLVAAPSKLQFIGQTIQFRGNVFHFYCTCPTCLMARTEIIYVTAIKLLISWQIRIWQNIWSLKNVKSLDFAFPIKHDVANRGRLGQGASMVWVVGSESVLTRDKKGRDWKFEKSWVTIDSTPHCTGNGQCYVSVGTNKKLIWKYVGCLFILHSVSCLIRFYLDWLN